MNETLFRQKSLDKVKSPENLDDYIQVSNPGMWLLLVSVIVLLAGACVWGIFGHLDSTVDTSIHAENGTLICFIMNEDFASVQEGMTVKFDEYEAVVTGTWQKEDPGYLCVLESEQAVPDGFYDGKIVTKSVRPLSFVLN